MISLAAVVSRALMVPCGAVSVPYMVGKVEVAEGVEAALDCRGGWVSRSGWVCRCGWVCRSGCWVSRGGRVCRGGWVCRGGYVTVWWGVVGGCNVAIGRCCGSSVGGTGAIQSVLRVFGTFGGILGAFLGATGCSFDVTLFNVVYDFLCVTFNVFISSSCSTNSNPDFPHSICGSPREFACTLPYRLPCLKRLSPTFFSLFSGCIFLFLPANVVFALVPIDFV